MTEPRSIAELMTDVQDAAERSAGLEQQLAAVVGRAASPDGTIRVGANVHGALVELAIADQALGMGADLLGLTITRLAGEATQAATVAALDLLAPAAGDALTIELAKLAGLGHLVQEEPGEEEPETPAATQGLPAAPGGAAPTGQRGPAPAVRPTRRPRPVEDDDDEAGFGSVLRSDGW